MSRKLRGGERPKQELHHRSRGEDPGMQRNQTMR